MIDAIWIYKRVFSSRNITTNLHKLITQKQIGHLCDAYFFCMSNKELKGKFQSSFLLKEIFFCNKLTKNNNKRNGLNCYIDRKMLQWSVFKTNIESVLLGLIFQYFQSFYTIAWYILGTYYFFAKKYSKIKLCKKVSNTSSNNKLELGLLGRNLNWTHLYPWLTDFFKKKKNILLVFKSSKET